MGKRVISSVLGIPLFLLGAIFVFFILQIVYDLIVRDINTTRLILLSISSAGLLILVGLSALKKNTVIRILKSQVGY